MGYLCGTCLSSVFFCLEIGGGGNSGWAVYSRTAGQQIVQMAEISERQSSGVGMFVGRDVV